MVVDENTAGMILERLELGQRVAVLTLPGQHARVAQQDVLGWMPEDQLEAARIRLGRAGRVELGDGRLMFLSLDQVRHGALRGYSLDAVYVPNGGPAWRAEDVMPCLVARDGIVLGYAL